MRNSSPPLYVHLPRPVRAGQFGTSFATCQNRGPGRTGRQPPPALARVQLWRRIPMRKLMLTLVMFGVALAAVVAMPSQANAWWGRWGAAYYAYYPAYYYPAYSYYYSYPVYYYTPAYYYTPVYSHYYTPVY